LICGGQCRQPLGVVAGAHAAVASCYELNTMNNVGPDHRGRPQADRNTLPIEGARPKGNLLTNGWRLRQQKPAAKSRPYKSGWLTPRNAGCQPNSSTESGKIQRADGALKVGPKSGFTTASVSKARIISRSFNPV